MTSFQARIAKGDTVWCVGIYDALSAKVAEAAGFEAVMTGGFSITATQLGLPDLEVLTMAENVDVARRVVSAVSVPVVSDIDTGYGNTINVARTVKEFKAAGVQAVVIEDQVSPKRCPALVDETTLISVDDAVGKIRAAVDASGGTMTIVARTDAFDPAEAIVRAKAYAAAGANLIQPVSKTFSKFEDFVELRKQCGRPLSIQILAWLEKLDPKDIATVAGLATFPLVPVMTVTAALMDNMKALRTNLTTTGLPRDRAGMQAFKDFIGFDAILREHQKYDAAPPAPAVKRAG
jgi:methylisocitrate lyase